tara:strand:+ start:652 stop:1446 length:795 start_codon:yes stop_codon:yes gene_type:complete
MSFEDAYVQAFAELTKAQQFHNKNNSRHKLNYNTMKPENFKTSFFYSRLSEPMRSYIKIMYDISLYGNNIISGFFRNVQERLHNCSVICNSQFDIERVYICDFKKTKTMLVPSDISQYVTLNNFIMSIIMDTELLSFASINQCKRMKQKTHYSNDTLLNTLRKAVDNGNEIVLGKFSAALVWILHSKDMNVVQNASMLGTGMSYCNGFNNESRIVRSNPLLKKEKTHTTIMYKEPEREIETENITEKLQKEDAYVPDSWEDFEL